MKYGLNKNTVEKINTVLSLFPQVEEVILYGSRAKGNYKNGSDIDLTFKGKDLNLKNLNAISNKLDELFLPYTFDLSVFEYIDNPELVDHINRVGISFYKKKEK
jgi:predicted nucleotidyltransferase